MCAELDVPHLINNAYGLQDSKCAYMVNEALRSRHVFSYFCCFFEILYSLVLAEWVVWISLYSRQIRTSWSLLAAPLSPRATPLSLTRSLSFIQVLPFSHILFYHLINCYQGRASSAPIVDLFVTLLQMGKETYLALLKERKEVYAYLKEKLTALALSHNERVFEVRDLLEGRLEI